MVISCAIADGETYVAPTGASAEKRYAVIASARACAVIPSFHPTAIRNQKGIGGAVVADDEVTRSAEQRARATHRYRVRRAALHAAAHQAGEYPRAVGNYK